MATKHRGSTYKTEIKHSFFTFEHAFGKYLSSANVTQLLQIHFLRCSLWFHVNKQNLFTELHQKYIVYIFTVSKRMFQLLNNTRQPPSKAVFPSKAAINNIALCFRFNESTK